MLRLHFAFEDIVRLSVAETADLGTETVLSLHTLTARDQDLRFLRWRRAARPTPATALLEQLCTANLLPAFAGHVVTPQWQETRDLAGREDPELRHIYLRRLADHRDLSRFSQALAEDDKTASTLFARALGAYQRSAIDAWMPQIETLVNDEGRDLARVAAGGLTDLLRNLHPLIFWDPPVLSVTSVVDADVKLNGRGLLIQPTVFAGNRPWVGGFDAPDRRPVLAVPLRRQPPLGEHEPRSAKDTVKLLGATRATLLRALAHQGPHTTGQLARLAGCSPASVSGHTAVLRASGLITTTRQGQSVSHAVTTLGAALVGAV